MKITRLDLDGTGSPGGIVTKILKVETDLKIPVPIEELAYHLDIREIGELTTEGFVGGLLTDELKNTGSILVRKGLDAGRRRFTIGHELGHFLIPFHKPMKLSSFLCSGKDMTQWNTGVQDRAAKMEVEANQFAALILMPPPQLRTFLKKFGDPSLSAIVAVGQEFEVSKEAAARAYVEHHHEPIAVALVHEGKLERIYKSRTFPRMCLGNGSSVPRGTNLQGAIGYTSNLERADAAHWLETDYGVRPPPLFAQSLIQKSGRAMILLWSELPEDDADSDEDKTSKQRYAERQTRWQR